MLLLKKREMHTKMNLDETRLQEIKEYKIFYHRKLKEENTELGKDLIQSQINKLDEEEQDILKRCKAL